MNRSVFGAGSFTTLALLATVSCGSSPPSQRDDKSSGAEVAGSAEVEESKADSSAEDGTLSDGGRATEIAQADDDPVEQAIATQKADGGEQAGTSTRKFKTSESVEKMSEFLVKPAKQAMKDKKYARAISLYSGLVAARGNGDESARQLARAWNLASQYEEAARVWSDFAAATDDDDKRVEAKEEVERLREFENPFSREFSPVHATQEAKEAYALGRNAWEKKKWADALFYYEVTLALDPTLAGTVREIGASYTKLGAADDATKFYLDYMWRKPAGAFVKDVLKELKQLKKTKELGYLNVTSKLKCDEVWVEGQMVKGLPIKKKPMAPGSYTWLCYSGRYGMAYFESIEVEPGKTKTLEFAWAVVVNALEKPWGRILLEDAKKPGVLRDIGIESEYPETGVVVPKDGSALQMQLKGPTGAVLEKRFVRLKPGDKLVVKWKP